MKTRPMPFAVVLCASLFSALALAATPSAPAPAPPPAPAPARVQDVPTDLFGTRVSDPYRWLEDTKSAETRAWMQSQSDFTRQTLDRIDGRDAIAKRLVELAQARGDAVYGIQVMPGERWFYMKRARGDKQFKLVMREGLAGAERVLVDPDREAQRTGKAHAVNFFKASWDGRKVAYGLSASGSEDASLFVMDVKTGRQLTQPLPRAHETPVHWLPDSQSLTVPQLAELKPGAPDTDTYKDSRVLWLKLARPAKPVPVFGPAVTTGLGLDRLDVAELIVRPGSRWMVARTTDTTVPEGKIFVAPRAQLGQPGTRWQRVATEADRVVDVDLQGDSLYVLTQRDAPRRKVVRVDLRQPAMATAALVAAEPKDSVLEALLVTGSGQLVVQTRRGTNLVLRRYTAGDTAGVDLPVQEPGSAALVRHQAYDNDRIVFGLSTWTGPGRLLRLEGTQTQEISLGVRAVPPGLPDVQVSEVMVTSHDGVQVPMTVLHKKGLPRDGSNPVLVDGYGSYGLSTSAYFSSFNVVWIERGGVLAFVNPRGSGVLGDDWHRAGFKTTKPNTWKDGIASAKWLIAQGYGSARTMGITGGSAGGIFVGRATTEAPELFAAAIYSVGALDTVRAEETANGATNISEFGTVKVAAEAKALLEMSTYHQIRDGQRYPAVMLTHGVNDPRVDVWNSTKTAARLLAAQAGLPNSGTVLLRLDMDAGHGVGNTLTQVQSEQADIQAFLLWQMGKLGLKD
jgi:prolyl oligopeptidase